MTFLLDIILSCHLGFPWALYTPLAFTNAAEMPSFLRCSLRVGILLQQGDTLIHPKNMVIQGTSRQKPEKIIPHSRIIKLSLISTNTNHYVCISTGMKTYCIYIYTLNIQLSI